MRKLKMIVALALSMIMVLVQLNVKVSAEHSSYDYYYENIDVKVDVYDDRTMRVTESLDVYYNKEMHGIIRDIPTYSSVEGYEVENVQLTGAEFKKTEYSSRVEVRIGSADITVTGPMHYELSYELKHYKDYDVTADYAYINLLGSDYDTYVDRFTGTIIFHDDLKVNSQNVTSGNKNSTSNSFVTYDVNDNIFTYSAQDIKPYNGITTMLQLDGGAFINAKEYDFNYVINNAVWSFDFNTEKDVLVKGTYTLTNNTNYERTHGVDLQLGDHSVVKIHDFTVLAGTIDKDDYSTSDHSVQLRIPANKTVTYQFTYTIHFLGVNNETTFHLLPIKTLDNTKVENFEYRISMPESFTYSTYVGRNTESKGKLDVHSENNTLYVKSLHPVYSGERLTIDAYYDNDMYFRQYPKLGTAVMIGGLVMAFLLFLQDKLRIDFGYRNDPPAGLNSLEVGYIYNGLGFSDAAAGSILLYWASKGYITIEQYMESNWTIRKQKEADKYMQAYEKTMFKGMFRLGQTDGNSVSSFALEKKFGPYMDKAKTAIIQKYSYGKYALEKEDRVKVHLLSCGIGLVLFMIIAATPIYFNTQSIASVLLGTLIAGVAFGYTLYKYNEDSELGKVKYGAIIVVVFMFAYGGLGMLIYDEQSILQLLFAFVVDAFATRYIFKYIIPTPLGKQLRTEVKRFRRFLKNYRETNQEDESFEYDMLPFAVALGLEKSWIGKFKGMKQSKPSWYVTRNDQNYNRDWCYYCGKFHHGVGRECNRYITPVYTGSYSSSGSSYSSSSSSSSSSYSGGGSSYSGGGSSGGGSGGGGSKGW